MASVLRMDQFVAKMRRRLDRAVKPSLQNDENVAELQRRGDAEYARSLSRLIESEIIPRLLVAHGNGPPLVSDAQAETIGPEEVAAFAPLALQVEADELLDYIERLVARGASLDALMVDLLAPAARVLGEMWEDDRCDFVDVTMGLWRLQEVVHELTGRVPQDHRQPPLQQRRALFASLEGDQHAFGTVVIDELFTANGWTTDRLAEATMPQLMERVRDEWFDLAGLTITRDCHIAPLPSIIRAIRASSRNPHVCVMVGGRIFVEDASMAASVGADGTAPDARIAVHVAGQLVDAMSRQAVSPMTG